MSSFMGSFGPGAWQGFTQREDHWQQRRRDNMTLFQQMLEMNPHATLPQLSQMAEEMTGGNNWMRRGLPGQEMMKGMAEMNAARQRAAQLEGKQNELLYKQNVQKFLESQLDQIIPSIKESDPMMATNMAHEALAKALGPEYMNDPMVSSLINNPSFIGGYIQTKRREAKMKELADMKMMDDLFGHLPPDQARQQVESFGFSPEVVGVWEKRQQAQWSEAQQQRVAQLESALAGDQLAMALVKTGDYRGYLSHVKQMARGYRVDDPTLIEQAADRTWQAYDRLMATQHAETRTDTALGTWEATASANQEQSSQRFLEIYNNGKGILQDKNATDKDKARAAVDVFIGEAGIQLSSYSSAPVEEIQSKLWTTWNSLSEADKAALIGSNPLSVDKRGLDSFVASVQRQLTPTSVERSQVRLDPMDAAEWESQGKTWADVGPAYDEFFEEIRTLDPASLDDERLATYVDAVALMEEKITPIYKMAVMALNDPQLLYNETPETIAEMRRVVAEIEEKINRARNELEDMKALVAGQRKVVPSQGTTYEPAQPGNQPSSPLNPYAPGTPLSP